MRGSRAARRLGGNNLSEDTINMLEAEAGTCTLDFGDETRLAGPCKELHHTKEHQALLAKYRKELDEAKANEAKANEARAKDEDIEEARHKRQKAFKEYWHAMVHLAEDPDEKADSKRRCVIL